MNTKKSYLFRRKFDDKFFLPISFPLSLSEIKFGRSTNFLMNWSSLIFITFFLFVLRYRYLYRYLSYIYTSQKNLYLYKGKEILHRLSISIADIIELLWALIQTGPIYFIVTVLMVTKIWPLIIIVTVTKNMTVTIICTL